MNDNLSERVARLERENRRLRIVGALVLVAFVGIFLMGQTPQPTVPESISAKQFVLVDKDGNTRSMIGTDDTGTTFIGFLDKDGKARAVFGTNENGVPLLRLVDANGKIRAKFELDADGLPEISLNDSGEQYRAGLMLSSDQEPFMSFYHSDGKPRIAFVVNPDGSAGIAVTDQNGNPFWKAPPETSTGQGTNSGGLGLR